MKHRLLILGTLGEFVQLVRKAREKGYYTIVCDGYSDGPAREFADEAYQIPVTDTEKIAELCREKEIDGIITSFSDLLLECMVKIADRAGLPCYLKPEQLPWYRDKSRTRELLQELGLPTPGFQKIPTAVLKDPDRKLRLKELLKGLRYPVVSKPLDKYGSRGIYISENLEELIKAAEKTAEFSDMPEILVEEYNDGYEFNMMTWVQKWKGACNQYCRPRKNIRRKRGNSYQYKKCLSIQTDVRSGKTCNGTSPGICGKDRPERRRTFHAVFLETRERGFRSVRLRPVFSDTNMNLPIWYTDLIWKNFFWLRCMTRTKLDRILRRT